MSKFHHWERVCRSNEIKPSKNLTVHSKGRHKGAMKEKQSKHVYGLNQSEKKRIQLKLKLPNYTLIS